jgi:molybdopterin converting factor small subunit
MNHSGIATVRVFGVLQRLQRDRGTAHETVESIPVEGISAAELADRMGLPVELIEGAFCNHTIHGLAHVVMPGDEVAFVPYGTPGPHRYFLGLYEAGRDDTP